MTVGRMLPRCWSDQNGPIARSINSIYLREDRVPLTSRGDSHQMFDCMFVSALDQWGLTRLREVKKANKTTRQSLKGLTIMIIVMIRNLITNYILRHILFLHDLDYLYGYER